MSWGHATSMDMLTWVSASVSPALIPGATYDCEGVFTGCWLPPSKASDKTLRVAYSSVKHLPFHWSTPPYPRNAAGLAIASSHDGGLTWEKSPRNPILPGEPAGVAVTGFRDPSVFELQPTVRTPRTPTPNLYGLIAGGVEGSGPNVFVYEIDIENPEDWNYRGTLLSLPPRFQPSNHWSGNYGVNWECVNLVTLRSDSETRHFLLLGAEGDVEKPQVKSQPRSTAAPSRTIRPQLWLSGELTPTSSGLQLRPQYGGYFDHGPYYAANSFHDPVSDRRIVYGWIPEEDISLEAAKAKGWNGSLAIPREMFLLTIRNVEGSMRSDLSDIFPFEIKRESDGSVTILTLGVRPIQEMARLREGCDDVSESENVITLPMSDLITHQVISQAQSANWELEAIISVQPGCKTVGFHVRHTNDLSVRTSITFCIDTETISVDRSASTTDPAVNTCMDAGPFTLLTQRPPGEEASLEKLKIRIFSDGNILEIFANDRFALATMVYSERCGPRTGGISAFTTGGLGSAVFEAVHVYDGLDVNKLPRTVDEVPG